ncbi:MAG: carboxyltransferase domain-containing protein [Candidatus Micrarchaeaceae archaeon]
MDNKYNVILDSLPEKENRVEVLFRQAGDGFLQVEYGRIQRANLLDSFRIQVIDKKIKENLPDGLIETLPGIRTNMLHFDPLKISISDLIEIVKKYENEVVDIKDIIISSRLIHLPIAFEDSETKKAVEKYVKEIRPDAPNVINGYNIEYIALCNGITSEEVKEMICNTEWYNSGGGFWPGGAFLWPMDPRCALVVPKYNPPRTWTPEGAVGIGGPCVFTYTTPTGGGYQLFGRTIPTFQFSQKHPIFKNSPFLYQNADRVKFHEVQEKEVLEIFEHVHDKTDYVYEIEEGSVSVKEYIEFISSKEVQKGVKTLKEKQAEGIKRAPRL